MIKIKEITKDNYFLACELTTNKTGEPTLYEEFICSNAMSLAEAKYDLEMQPRTIHWNDTLIGFFMYKEVTEKQVMIYRFMLDYRFHQKGLGKKAIAAILEYLKNEQDVLLGVDPKNDIAKSLYQSFGFQFTGEINHGEHYYLLKR